MKWIEIDKGNCSDCYKCLRSCPSKAIKILDGSASVIEDMCIVCGHCQMVCPQNIIKIKSRLGNVKDAIDSGRNVIASIAPSFAGAFAMTHPAQFGEGLKKLGFDSVQETAIGADYVKEDYMKALSSKTYKNFITSSCPSANYLIEKYYPVAADQLANTISPMLAHGKLIKKEYPDAFTVFIGPCIAKKQEAYEYQQKRVIDEVLTFEEISEWLKEENIILHELEYNEKDYSVSRGGSSFPIKGGIFGSLQSMSDFYDYQYMQVDGAEECTSLLDAIRDENLEGLCVELNMCEGSCICGPAMPKDAPSCYTIEKKVRDYVKNSQLQNSETENVEKKDIDLYCSFTSKEVLNCQPTDEQITEILHSMGKYKPNDELNCNTCGYKTCRDKAKAVFCNMSEITMCLPYVRKKAESIRNTIFKYTPNSILLLDASLNILEANPQVEKLLGENFKDLIGINIEKIVGKDILFDIRLDKSYKIDKKLCLQNPDLCIIFKMSYLKDEKAYMVIMSDITAEEKNIKALNAMKEKTLDSAQEVIDKQMRVAQEIASLLGETTAETKIILTRLKKIAMDDERLI